MVFTGEYLRIFQAGFAIDSATSLAAELADIRKKRAIPPITDSPCFPPNGFTQGIFRIWMRNGQGFLGWTVDPECRRWIGKRAVRGVEGNDFEGKSG